MVELTLENFEEEVLNSSRDYIVTFKSNGCHLCRGLVRVVFKLRRKYIGSFKFGHVDIGQQSDLAEIFDVGGVPTMFLFKSGDGVEIPYPENPSIFSGYSEGYLIKYLDGILDDEQ